MLVPHREQRTKCLQSIRTSTTSYGSGLFFLVNKLTGVPECFRSNLQHVNGASLDLSSRFCFSLRQTPAPSVALESSFVTLYSFPLRQQRGCLPSLHCSRLAVPTSTHSTHFHAPFPLRLKDHRYLEVRSVPQTPTHTVTAWCLGPFS